MVAKLETHWLVDDGVVPNNATVPTRIYRGALPAGADAARAIEAHLAANGWSNAWVDGIYDYHHYHATVHEVLGVARGTARVQLGGPSGPIVVLTAGDGVLIPAGVGHCRLGASPDLSVVGAYPGGADWDLVRATAEARAAALARIAQCESGGNPQAVSASGQYRGKYQFDLGTWQSLGGSGDPAAASEAEQDRIAAILYARSGPAPWPVCGYR